jgi:hypothetical protein
LTTLELPDSYDEHSVFGVGWDDRARRLSFDGNGVAVTCARPNLEVTATDRVVRYERRRRWRIGGLETGGPWQDD